MEKYEIEAIPVTKVAGKSTRPAALLLAALMPISRVMHANTMKMNSSSACVAIKRQREATLSRSPPSGAAIPTLLPAGQAAKRHCLRSMAPSKPEGTATMQPL